MVLLIITAMVGAAEILHQHEIIFPEITAIAVGALMAPKMTWNTSRSRILIFIMICALCGVGIVLFVPGPVWFKVTLAYGIAEVIYLCSGTSFAPMISAIALPVLLGTESAVYPIAAFLLTVLMLNSFQITQWESTMFWLTLPYIHQKSHMPAHIWVAKELGSPL